jgi:hypothetical protein
MLRECNFAAEVGFAVEVQPRLVTIGVIADFVSRFSHTLNRRMIPLEGGVLANNEKSNP